MAEDAEANLKKLEEEKRALEEKNKISHRALALQAMLEEFKKHNFID